VPGGSSPTDFDNDGITDSADACVEVPRGTDANGDGCPDRAAALSDADGDGIPDSSDACPSTAAGGTDANGDGCPDTSGGDTGGGGTGGGGTGSGGGNPSGGGPILDLTAPRLTFFRAPGQRPVRAKALRFTASCSEACRLTAVARLGRTTLGRGSRNLATGTPTGLRVRLSKKGLSALRKALRRRRTARVSLALTLRDAAGNAASASRRITVRR
jgi:Thrombospondin type 3 repeat